MEGHINFYKLDRTKPVKFEGHNGKISAILILGIVFITLILGAAIYTFAAEASLENNAIAAIAFFVFFGSVLLGFGILRQRKLNGNNRIERSLLKNCICTDAMITEYECARHSYSQENGSSYYKVTILYTYYNENYEPQSNTFRHTYSSDPEFYEGQWLVVAFNDYCSAILKKFTFVQEDEQKFLKNEAVRSDDDFENLDSSPVAVDLTKKISSAEKEVVWLWAAVIILVTSVAIIFPLMVFVMPSFDTGNIALDISFKAVKYIVLTFFICVGLSCLTAYIKKHMKLKKILKSNPNFARGKMFASEKTYRNKSKKEICYCYIDFYGGRHTETVSGIVLRKRMQSGPVDTVIMYDGKGNSIPLCEYTLIGED